MIFMSKKLKFQEAKKIKIEGKKFPPYILLGKTFWGKQS